MIDNTKQGQGLFTLREVPESLLDRPENLPLQTLCGLKDIVRRVGLDGGQRRDAIGGLSL